MMRWGASTSTLVVVLLTVATAGGGCASLGSVDGAVDKSRSIVSSGVDEATDSAEEADVELQARLNPCRCPAPDFEIHVRGRWRRVIIEAGDASLVTLRDEATTFEDSRQLAVLWLRGDFSGSATHAGSGREYPRFVLHDFRVDADVSAGSAVDRRRVAAQFLARVVDIDSVAPLHSLTFGGHRPRSNQLVE